MRILDQANIRWGISIFGNAAIVSAIIRRRVWTTLPALGFILAVNASMLYIEYANYHSKLAWEFSDIGHIFIYIALAIALKFYRLYGVADALPLIYVCISACKIMQYVYGYYPSLHGHTPPEIAFATRVWFEAVTSYLLAFCIWSRRIVAEEIHYAY